MIESDGKPTIASKQADPLLREALEKGGHLGDDVARVLLEEERWLKSNQRAGNLQMSESAIELLRGDGALDATLHNLRFNIDRAGHSTEYALFGSTPLIMRGILDREPGDVDVFVSKHLWGAMMQIEGWNVITPAAGDPPILVAFLPLETHLFYAWRDDYVQMDAPELIRTAEVVNGWRCVTVEEALRVKEAAYAARFEYPKVLKHGPDIEIIKRWLDR